MPNKGYKIVFIIVAICISIVLILNFVVIPILEHQRQEAQKRIQEYLYKPLAPQASQPSIPSDWETFQNYKYGFAISLPPNYELQGPNSNERSEYFYIRNKDPMYIPDYYLTVYQAGSDKTYWYGAGLISEETVVINGIPGRKIVFKTIDPGGKEGQCTFYELRAAQYTYTFTGYESCFEGDLALSILNTFKLTK